MEELKEEVKDWQAIGKQAEEKDVDWTDYKENHKDCWEAYVENPLAKGYVDRIIDFVIKEGFEVTSEDTKTQEAIDRIKEEWNWFEFQIQACRESAIYGELFSRMFGTDAVFYDPSSITAIRTDPENVKKSLDYLHEYTTTELDENGNATNSKIHKEWIEAEEIIHQAFNTVSTAKRGISDLLCVLKWLTRHKQVATNLVRRTNIHSSIVGIKRIKGPGISAETVGGWKKTGDDTTSSESSKRMERAIKPGTWYVCGPNVDYELTSIPNDMKGMTDLLKMLVKIIVAGLGLAEHYLGDTSESNLATASSLELPILSKLERRQNELKGFFKKCFDKALAEEGIEEAEFDIIPPELSDEDAKAFAESFKILAEGLSLAVDNEWISDETASKTLGDPINFFESFEDESKKIEEERKKREEEKKRREKENPELAGGNPPPQLVQPPAQVQQFQQAISEAEFKFQKVAMDDLIKNYGQAFVDSFNKAKKKVLADLERIASERRSQQGS